MARRGPRNPGLWAGVFLFLIIITGPLALTNPAQAATATVSLQMVGEAPQFDGTTPVLVAGIWHQITVNLSAPATAAVLVTAVLPGAQPKGMANDYAWSYNPSNGTWTDVLYGVFVRADLSTGAGTQLVLAGGVDAQATPGTWTLSVTEGNATLASLAVEVQAPNISAGLSVADFVFQADPFTPVNLDSEAAGQYLRLVNDGNVPLGLTVSFDILRSNLSLVNPTATAHLGSDAKFYVQLTMGPQPPQLIGVSGTSDVAVRNVIPSPGATSLVPSIRQPFPVTVQVGHGGYALKVVGNVVFQTIDALAAKWGSVTTWQVYLTGSQGVSLDVAVSGARLVGITSGGTSLTLPATLSPTTTSELAVTIQVEPTDPNGGSVVFTLHLLSTGDTRTFTTSLVVQGGPASSGAGTVSLIWIAGAAMAAAVFAFVSFNTVRHRARLRAAAEKPKKKGYNARRQERARTRGPNHGHPPHQKARSNGVGQDQRHAAPDKGSRR